MTGGAWRAVVGLVLLPVCACSHPAHGSDQAHAACVAYATATGREAGGPPRSARAEALAAATEAARRNAGFAALARDVAAALRELTAGAVAHNSGEGAEVVAADMNRFFAADRAVRDDCRKAGREIGILKP